MTTYRIVAYPPTEKMVVAVWRSMPLCTSELQECVADMLAASPQPDTVLTDEEREALRERCIMGSWTPEYLIGEAEAAVLRKLRGET